MVLEKHEPQCNVYVRRAKRAKIQTVALQFGGDSGKLHSLDHLLMLLICYYAS